MLTIQWKTLQVQQSTRYFVWYQASRCYLRTHRPLVEVFNRHRVFGTKYTQPLETTEGTHSPGISCNPPTMWSFCSKRKFHCPSKVAAASASVTLRTQIFRKLFWSLGKAGATQEAKLPLVSFGTGQPWSPQMLPISDFLNNKSLLFTYSTGPMWVWGGSWGDGGVGGCPLRSHAGPQVEGVSTSAHTSAFASQGGGTELEGLLLAFCKISTGKDPPHWPELVPRTALTTSSQESTVPLPVPQKEDGTTYQATVVISVTFLQV